MAGEADGIGAEGIGLDDAGAGANVVAVDLRDEFGPADAELLETAFERNAEFHEISAHRAITREHA